MKNYFKIVLSFMTLSLLISCSEDDPAPEPRLGAYSALGSIDGAYYLASTQSLTEGSLSFENNGTQLDADQAARIIASGEYMYSLNYGTGIMTQLQLTETGAFETVAELNVGQAVGTTRPRYKLADKNTIMVYNVETVPVTNDNDEVIDQTCTLMLANISIPDLSIAGEHEFVIPQTENAAQGATIGYHPMRVDAPVISGSKIYFGLMHMDMYDPSTPPPFRVPKQTGLETLVFDFPSFENGAIVESDAAAGHTGGYRAPSMHVDESGDVYQSNWFMSANNFDLSAGDKTVITRLRNGAYDNSYTFNVSDALGLDSNVGTAGWFYVGNGIGYMPLHLEDAGNYYTENSWSVARVDVYNQTAVLLDVPLSGLFSYESGIIDENKFYMAISPIGGSAYVYEFDPSSSSSDAFTSGLALDGANVIVDGLYY